MLLLLPGAQDPHPFFLEFMCRLKLVVFRLVVAWWKGLMHVSYMFSLKGLTQANLARLSPAAQLRVFHWGLVLLVAAASPWGLCNIPSVDAMA
jgi:hypothetical protein